MNMMPTPPKKHPFRGYSQRGRTHNSFAIVWIALCLVFLLSACGRSTYHYTDNKDVKVKEISHVKEGDFLIVHAELWGSSKSGTYHPVYRMEWFDENGNLLEKTSWRPAIIKGNVPLRITERSTVPGAKEYTLILSNDAR